MSYRAMLSTLLVLLTSSMLPNGYECLRVVKLSVPTYASLGEPVSMSCLFELGMGKLYSVKWYKDGDEFCRFMPGYQPQSQLFTTRGILMDESGCRMSNVTLKAASLDTTGSYRCEVSTESPNFETDFRNENLTVRALPKGKPHISGVQSSYTPGEWVVASCSYGPSLPAATFQWLLNLQPVDKSWVQGSVSHATADEPDDDVNLLYDEDDEDLDDSLHKPVPEIGDESMLLKSRTTLRFQARPEHFSGPTRELDLRCEARIHDLTWFAERRAALAGPGGKQHLLSQVELDHNVAGAVTAPSLLMILLLRMAATFVSS